MNVAADKSQPSAVERLERALQRIRAAGPESRATFTEVFEESARREAGESDERVLGGKERGPFDGRIVSVKALFDVAGTVTSSGSAVLRGLSRAASDAVVVKRLRAAGAVIVGKTQMTEFAFSALGTNPHDGVPGNPRDRQRAPGGSSSGAVVSVVDGIAEVAIGSDTGGSIRIPASLSGAVGFKPTSGRIPTVGAFPCCVRFPCVHAAATTPVQQLGVIFALAPSHISLPRYPCRVGLHVGFFEVCSAFTHVAACTRARSPSRDRYPEASDISSPPCLLRLLPAGADAGWDLHPLESAALHGARDMQPSQIAIGSSGLSSDSMWWQTVFSLEVSQYYSVFSGRSDIFGAFGPLRSLQNFALSE